MKKFVGSSHEMRAMTCVLVEIVQKHTMTQQQQHESVPASAAILDAISRCESGARKRIADSDILHKYKLSHT